ncbi:hypothetical protein MAR_001378 [Mya arenaria]|uniref:RING-type domain-containing protein n=1 Tax=Mya arenaria TaxID=6604 RepID=A0ABY7FBM0_MYAAR|nr:hypothetical protein MAR_001378 [Mya arenaria]
MKTSELESFQQSYEQRFGCCICLGPRLQMVSGQCQHRICVDCLYVDEERRPCMEVCPVCSQSDSFPRKRPILPSQVLEVQKCLGVQLCQSGCGAEMCCPKSKEAEIESKTPVKKRRRSRINDIGPVSTTRHTPSSTTQLRKRATRSQSLRITRSTSDQTGLT